MLADRLQSIRERIKKAAEKSGRTENDVTLVAVGKTVPAGRILECAGLGVRHLGENKVQEALAKRAELAPADLTHHFIGHLQTNKARKAVELFDVIQTVDRPALAETLDRIGSENGKVQRCFIEVKVSDEPTKSGISISEAEAFIQHFSSYPHLKLEGLMTIGPNEVSVDQTRRAFQSFVQLADRMKKYLGPSPELSFGMSDDFEMAIEEGATMIRLGRALFGERVL